jgi:hypothetical protein
MKVTHVPECPSLQQGAAASKARQRRSRHGNPEPPVIASRRGRRGNPDKKPLDCFTSFAMTGMHRCLAGLLHFVRNDGKGAMNYGSINKK